MMVPHADTRLIRMSSALHVIKENATLLLNRHSWRICMRVFQLYVLIEKNFTMLSKDMSLGMAPWSHAVEKLACSWLFLGLGSYRIRVKSLRVGLKPYQFSLVLQAVLISMCGAAV